MEVCPGLVTSSARTPRLGRFGQLAATMSMLSSVCCSTSAARLLTSDVSWRTMEKKRKRRSPNSEELDRSLEETSRLIKARRAYHQALIAREKARRQLPWYRRIFTA